MSATFWYYAQRFIGAGAKLLREALYMPALVTTRFNPDMKRAYETLVNAK